MIILDIETGPLPKMMLDLIKPEFTAGANLKDPEKIKAAIAEKEKDWYDRAALSPLTGQVLAIGVWNLRDKQPGYIGGDCGEDQLLEAFWSVVELDYPASGQFIGYNITGFDLPFLFRRSWKHGIRPPSFLRKGRYWTDCVVDLMEIFAFHNRDQRESLDTVCRYMGLGEKTGSGKDFAGLWESDRPKAIEYLTHDLKLTKALWERLCT
jgi:Predicted 3'-5' exonuclease related to the exonuclease domain of PolB